MRKNIALVAALLSATVIGSGCATNAYYNTDYALPISIDEEHRAFVMPADLHVPGADASMGLAFMAGIASACGTACLPGQPLKPVLERMGINNLSWMLAEGMYHAASVHGGETWDHDYTRIPDMLGGLFNAINEAFPGANLNFIVVGHVDDMGSRVPNTTKMRALGGLYDIQERRIATVFWYEQTMPEDTVRANVAAMGNRILSLAVCPTDDCGGSDDAANGIENVNVVHF